jgi:hypothetical protein
MKNIPKEAAQITRKVERLLLDITWVRTASFAGVYLRVRVVVIVQLVKFTCLEFDLYST